MVGRRTDHEDTATVVGAAGGADETTSFPADQAELEVPTMIETESVQVPDPRVTFAEDAVEVTLVGELTQEDPFQ